MKDPLDKLFLNKEQTKFFNLGKKQREINSKVKILSTVKKEMKTIKDIEGFHEWDIPREKLKKEGIKWIKKDWDNFIIILKEHDDKLWYGFCLNLMGDWQKRLDLSKEDFQIKGIKNE